MVTQPAARPVAAIRLIGGRPCLDFVNTIHDRLAPEREDYIADGARYLAWAVRAGLLSRAERAVVARRGVPAGVLREARELREGLHDLLSARVDGALPPRPAAETLGQWIRRAWGGLRLDLRAPDRLAWSAAGLDARLPLKRVALSALDLLQHGDPARLKRCAAASACGWLFYDETKNGARRWCSMDTCGVAAKMRRYRGRRRFATQLACGSPATTAR